MSTTNKAFFAFPNSPSELKAVIEAAGEHVRARKAQITLWPQMDIFGAWIPNEVRNALKRSTTAFFDVTIPNQNVYYEMGFALGMGLRVGPVLNTSFIGATEQIKHDGIFDNLGYRSYENSKDLKDILERKPKGLQSHVFRREVNFRQPLYLLDTDKKTDLRNSIVSSIKESGVFYRSFDPTETPRFTAIQAIGDVSASAGVIVPFLGEHIAGYELHNLRAAFVTGLCHGMGRRVMALRLASKSLSLPVDFKDDVVSVKDSRSIKELIVPFARDSVIAAQNIEPERFDQKTSALRSVWLGAVAAENEFRTLANYFVQTAEFARTVRGEVKALTGRKGSGKTAIFFQARDTLRRQGDAIVVDLKPESHQLQEFRNNLTEIVGAGLIDHTCRVLVLCPLERNTVEDYR